MRFDAMQDIGYTVLTSLIWIIIFSFDEALKYGYGANFEVMLGRTLNHSEYNFVILCNVTRL
jgi:hypothetical protein